MKKALAAIYLVAASIALASDLGGDGLGGAVLQPRANSVGLGEPGLANRELAQVDPVMIAAGEPSLDFRFADNKWMRDSVTNEQSLITFSRSAASSPGTYVGADGLIKEAAVNEVLYSEQFDNAAWTKTNATVLANQIVAPDGKQTAEKLVATSAYTGFNTHRVFASASISSTSTASIYVKQAGLPYAFIRNYSATPTPLISIAVFNLSSASLDYSQNVSSTSIDDVGDGWYRISATFARSGFQNFGVASSGYTIVGDEVVSTGNDVDGIYLWGAQLEEGTVATPYIRTTSQALAAPRFDHDPVTGESLGLLVEEARSNLLTYSNGFEQASWVAFGSDPKALPATINAPDGGGKAGLFIPNSASGLANHVTRQGPITTVASGQYTASLYLKDAGNGFGSIIIWGGGADFVSATVDLSNGAVTNSGSAGIITLVSATASDAGNGWYRLNVTFSQTGTSTYIYAGSYTTDTFSGGLPTKYVANDVDGTYFFGAQLEAGAFPTSYIPTVGSLSRAADVAAVQDADFSTTNLLAYSESFDVGWATARLEPVTANATTAPDGSLTADYIEQESGQTTAGGVFVSRAYTGQEIISVYAKAAQKDFLRIYDAASNSAYFNLSTGSVGTVSGGSATIQDAGNGWYRCTLSTTRTGTANMIFYVADADNSSTVTDSGGIYLWGASLTATEYPVAYTTTRNLLTDSQDFERGTWQVFGAGASKISDASVNAPDGTRTAYVVNPGTVGGPAASASAVYKTTSVLADDYVFSVWVRTQTGTSSVRISSTVAGVTYGGSADLTISESWSRLSFSFTSATSGGANVAIRTNVAGTTGDIVVWGAQLEPGTAATDYVRTVDVVGKAYRWYEPTEGTVWVEAQNPASGTRGIVGIDDNTANERIEAQTDGTDPEWLVIDGGSGTTIDAGSITAYTFFSLAGAYKHNDLAASVNGGAAVTGTDTIPSVNLMRIGALQASGTYLNGHIKRLTYWPVRLPDATLGVITQ